MIPAIIALAFLAILLIVLAVAGVRIVRPYQRGILEQLGKYKATKDPGLHIIIPFVQSLQTIDMREQVVDVPPQEVITSDNVVVSVDAVIYFEPTDPQRLVYNIANFFLAITKLAQTNLRNVIGDLSLDQALTSRDQLNMNLRQILDDATDKWGVRVMRVEIQRIDPPPDVMSAMHEQMKAERYRRAQVLTADGTREAAILAAEGQKQAAILAAQGIRERQILEAQGQAQAARELADAERYRQETIAAGEAQAIEVVYDAIHQGRPTNDLLAIKYLDALKGIADGRATKIFLPLDAGGLYGTLAGVAELFRDGEGAGVPSVAPDPARAAARSAARSVASSAASTQQRMPDAGSAPAQPPQQSHPVQPAKRTQSEAPTHERVAAPAAGVPAGWTAEQWAAYQRGEGAPPGWTAEQWAAHQAAQREGR